MISPGLSVWSDPESESPQLNIPYPPERLVEQEDLIEFIICDNGKSLGPEDIEALKKDLYSSDSPNKEFTAMHNVHKRLQLLYGESGKILLTPNDDTGLCVHIIIPIDKTFHQSTGLSTDRIE